MARDPLITAAQALAQYLRYWTPNTGYTAGQFVLNPSGQVVSALATFTSPSVYNPANWSAPLTAAPHAASHYPGGTDDISSVYGRRCNIQVFLASGTFTPTVGAAFYDVQAIGQGAGGESGTRGVAGGIRKGGASGGAGAPGNRRIPAASLSTPVVVTFGAGAVTGGAGQTVNDTAGLPGNPAAPITVTFGLYLTVSSGLGGGRSGSGVAGAGGAYGTSPGSAGAAASNGVAGLTSVGSNSGPAGGGSGGGLSAADAASAGGVGGYHLGATLGGVGAAGAINNAGGNATATPVNSGIPGHGGGGGGSSVAGPGGAGGNGADYGAGGGGGGASVNGQTSGPGGNGGAAILIVTTWF